MTNNILNRENIRDYLSKDHPIFTDGLFNSQDKARLEPLTRKPFFELIEKKNEKKLPYILGVTPDCFHSEMDGVRLHKSYKTYGLNPYTGNKIKDIYFYTINKDEDELTYLGRMGEEDELKRAFLDTFVDANEGDGKAQLKLGDFYSIGKGVKKDLNEALKYYSLALNSGHEIPSIKLRAIAGLYGDYYLNGNGVEKSPSKAMYYYQLAARNGCVNSQFKMGLLLERGREGIEKNIQKATEYYKLASAQDHPGAMIKAASFCIIGQNQNIQEATHLINRIADLKFGENHPLLQSWIATMREAAPYDEKFQIATSRLYMQCSKGQRANGNHRALTDVTNTAQGVNQSSFMVKG